MQNTVQWGNHQNLGHIKYFNVYACCFTCQRFFFALKKFQFKIASLFLAEGRKLARSAYNQGLMVMGSFAFAFINPACLDAARIAVAAGIITEFGAEKSAGRVAPGKTKRPARTVKLSHPRTLSAQNYTRRHARCGFRECKICESPGRCSLNTKMDERDYAECSSARVKKPLPPHRTHMYVYWSSVWTLKMLLDEILLGCNAHVQWMMWEWKRRARANLSKMRPGQIFCHQQRAHSQDPFWIKIRPYVFRKQSGAKVFCSVLKSAKALWCWEILLRKKCDFNIDAKIALKMGSEFVVHINSHSIYDGGKKLQSVILYSKKDKTITHILAQKGNSVRHIPDT